MASNKNECVKYAQKYNRQNELPFIYFASEFRMVICVLSGGGGGTAKLLAISI